MHRRTHCRSISKGIATGEALVSKTPIGFNFGVDTDTGKITEFGHELEGQSITGRILVFPNGKGSTGGSYVLYQLAAKKTGPAAIINLETETIIAVGAIMGRLPVVDKLEDDLYAKIKTGDWLTVDANEAFVQWETKEG